ncbi:hypothetical protein RIF29_19858 [Crotalaria pallida]|uniref:Uncharacterized protein n=1 Tax=Crotalaria pallida TaxID=3830 RepID=A0AAN9F4E1_CROPI
MYRQAGLLMYDNDNEFSVKELRRRIEIFGVMCVPCVKQLDESVVIPSSILAAYKWNTSANNIKDAHLTLPVQPAEAAKEGYEFYEKQNIIALRT